MIVRDLKKKDFLRKGTSLDVKKMAPQYVGRMLTRFDVCLRKCM